MKKITALMSLVLLANAAAWAIAFFICVHSPLSLGLCLLAYGFGLRHGVDADHIAAIDAVTRKLVRQTRNDLGVGIFFSLGHSAVVILLTLLVAVTTYSFRNHFSTLSAWGGFWGGLLSAGFLLLFAVINFYIFCDVWKKLKGSNAGEIVSTNLQLTGPMGFFLKPLLNIINKSWHMLLVGFLFGLGFDTATEVALLGMSGYQAAHFVSAWTIMIFPALFAAGMCLVDTVSGLVMLGACHWAYVNPRRKLHYNLVITLFSFATSFLIGVYQVLNSFSEKFDFRSAGHYLNSVDRHFELIGCFMIVLFLLTWVLSKSFINQEGG